MMRRLWLFFAPSATLVTALVCSSCWLGTSLDEYSSGDALPDDNEGDDFDGGTTVVDSSGDEQSDASQDAAVVHPCLTGQHNCNGTCVKPGDPKYGCAPNVCEPCPQPPNTIAGCMLNECSITCIDGTKDCNGSKIPDGCEINTRTDPMHCGDCNMACSAPNVAEHLCEDGKCQVGSCMTDFANCDEDAVNGCEVDLKNDPNNCGVCGNKCDDGSTSGSIQTCVDGKCVIDQCTPPLRHCTGEAELCETNTSSDVAHCGQCNKDCRQFPYVAAAECVDSTCDITLCQTGYDNCDDNPETGCETNIFNLVVNCGKCGFMCSGANSTNPLCKEGKCIHSPNCEPGFGDCKPHEGGGAQDDGCETRLNTLQNCGACGAACKPLNATGDCSNNTCTIGACYQGYTDCNIYVWGCETNIKEDRNNCGKCGNRCVTGPNATGVTCEYGTCTQACIAGYGDCNEVDTDGCEVNTQTDTNHCGECNVPCKLPNTATHKCDAGICQVDKCKDGWANCDGLHENGCETPLDTTNNCGKCGNKCSYPNAAAECSARTCTMGACKAGWANCNDSPLDGCEVNTTNTVAHCGGCNKACVLNNTVSYTCEASTCKVAACRSGFGNCNGQHTDGCEVNLNTDVNHCSTCGNACRFPHADASCASGTCTMGTCNTGWANCDGATQNGCEIDLNNDPKNCKTCGNVCSFPYAGALCTSGTCAIGTCNPGRGNCDGSPTNGCEINLNTDSNNCKTCGNVCSFPHAGASCVNGSCAIGTCNPGRGNCDGIPTNGCEADLKTDPNNCNTCGNVCSFPHAGASCVNGTCTMGACQSGWGNCDGIPTNGCETDLKTDPNNCNTCGNVCSFPHAGASCVNGSCRIGACNPGRYECNNNPNDGCESAAPCTQT